MSADLPTTRLALQLLATHVLARRRHAVTGHFGLRPAPGGLGTPAFGDDVEVVRIDGRLLVHERGGDAAVAPVSTLAAAAELVGVDLSTEFNVGDDTRPLTAVDEPLPIEDAGVRTLGRWWSFGAQVIDEAIATTTGATDVATPQLWPEHFDLGAAVTVGGRRFNLGASPGDGFEGLPYLYVSPWTDDRPGDPAYWNAPFGAVLRAADLPVDLSSTAAHTAAANFLREGLRRS